jgi:hypothetical protein
MVAVLSLGLVLIHCGGGGDDKQCETNEDCPQGYWCDRTVWECKEIDCIPNCTGKCCGDDGCQGTCPNNCPTGYECNMTSCQCEATGCTTDSDCQATECCNQGVCVGMSCGLLECGPDPVCGKECGPCGAGTHCDAGTCVTDVACTTDAQCAATECCIAQVCTPMACATLECGPDPVCSKECGPCQGAEVCQGGQCVTQGSGNLGDPCTFDTVNATAGACNAGLECLGIMADGGAGTCPGGSSTECTSLLEEWNRDCVGGNCGASFCSEPCGAGDTCPQGFIPQDVGNPPACMCVPGSSGSGNPGDPCPWDTVHATEDECQAGMACLGNDDIGSCPGGTDAECTGVADSWNPTCVSGICGFSFCSEECVGGACDAGFNPADVSGTCYCIPEEGGTSQQGEPCPFGDMNNSYDFCASGLTCLGNDNTGTCPGGTAAECGISDLQNPDCVNGICGFSHCTAQCDAQGNCETGYVPADVGGTCYCVPGETGTAQAGDPCPFTGGVNENAENCAAGLACLGFPADGVSGSCPGGSPTECTDVPASANPDCVNGECGASFCAEECDAQGNCPAGFVGQDVGGTCYCIPS